MKQVSKSQLKAKMLEYFRKIEETHEGVIVTDHGRPTLRIVPFRPKKSAQAVFGKTQGMVRYHEPLTTPTTDEWHEV